MTKSVAARWSPPSWPRSTNTGLTTPERMAAVAPAVYMPNCRRSVLKRLTAPKLMVFVWPALLDDW